MDPGSQETLRETDGANATSPSGGERPQRSRLLPEGATVGRYVIHKMIGRGAMGVVYEAHDPDLDRRLAIKILRVRGRSEQRRQVARTRLVREAQALAKLVHPNVVAVHDVGRYGEGVFIVMDFVEGVTLKAWLKTPREQPAVLDVFVGAGRGLAAAHRVGLVHRDFKPENVMVTPNGSAVVLDFGLARATAPGVTTSGPHRLTESGGSEDGAQPTTGSFSGSSGTLGSSAALGENLTRKGAVMGTPAYMAPEQHLGEATVAASDQFSYCIALYEALYRQSPFDGTTVSARAVRVIQGELRPAPRRSGVSRHVHRVLLRGLSVEPEQRFPSMEALLEALHDDPRPRRQRLVALGALLFAVGLGAATVGRQTADMGACEGGEEALRGVWDPGVRDRVTAAFEESGHAYAAATLARVLDGLDGYTARWVDTRREACLATEVRKEQSAELLDLRMACLERHREDLQTLTGLLVTPDEATIEHAVETVRALPPLADCNDGARLRARAERLPEATDPEVHAELRREIAAARVLEKSGHYQEAITRLAPALAKAREVEDVEALAHALLAQGSLHEADGRPAQAELALLEAARAAEIAEAPELLAQVRTTLVLVVGDRLARTREGHQWADFADTALRRSGNNTGLRSELLNNRGLVMAHEGRLDDQLAALQQALELLEGEADSDPIRQAGLHNNLAGVLADLGRHDEAATHAKTARERWARELGPDHPRVAIAIATRAYVHDVRGEYVEAARANRQALKLLERALGEEHLRLSEVLNNLSINLVNLGELEQAEASFRRVLAIKRRALGEDHPEVGSALGNLATCLRLRERFDEAAQLQLEALRISELHLEPDSPKLPILRVGMANTYALMGRPEEAIELYKRALGQMEERHGPDHPKLANDRANLAYALADAGRMDEALRHAQRAFVTGTGPTRAADGRAFVRIVLARVLLDVDRPAHTKQARALVRQAVIELGDLAAPTERRLIAELAAKHPRALGEFAAPG